MSEEIDKLEESIRRLKLVQRRAIETAEEIAEEAEITAQNNEV